MIEGERLLLDTHIWLRFMHRSSLMKASVADRIDRAADRNSVFVAVISVWEIAMLERDGKISMSGGVSDWTDEALSKPGIFLVPFSPEIAIASVQLPRAMHKDPADRILVASAKVERMTLVTADRLILAFARETGLSVLKG